MKIFFLLLKPYILKIWESKIMQQKIIPSFFTIGLISSFYFCLLFFNGCESVNQGFVKVVEIHTKEISKDYEQHLKHPDNPLFISHQPVLDNEGNPTGLWKRVELPQNEDREKIINSRWHSVEELLRVIQEQKEGDKEE